MSNAYKIQNPEQMHFVTFTVIGWVDVFSRQIYRDYLVENLKYCQQEKALEIHAWVIMTNHLHLILSASTNPTLTDVIRDYKKHTSKGIKELITNGTESRKDWMLNYFEWQGKQNPNNTNFQFWMQDNHPVSLYSNEMMKQKLDYIHMNPVRAGFVAEPEHWQYSSAVDYAGGKGLLPISFIK